MVGGPPWSAGASAAMVLEDDRRRRVTTESDGRRISVAPGLHLLPRSAVICALAPRISARRRALKETLDIDDSELSSLRCGCVARLATSLAPDAAPDPLDPRGAPRRRYPPGD